MQTTRWTWNFCNLEDVEGRLQNQLLFGCHTKTAEEEGVDHSRYLASDKKQERNDKQSQIRQAEGEIQAAEHSRRPESDEDDKGRQVDLHGVKSSRRGRHCSSI